MSCDLFIFAGEKSGDLHGEKLLEALFAKAPSLRVAGVGGPLMRTQPMNCLLPTEEFQVMGFIDVFFSLPKLRRHFYFLAKSILKLQPKVVVTIDYPGFNLRLIHYLRKKGFKGKLVHFICPSVWAHGKQRIPLMTNHLDLLLCILPFETQIFKDTPLQTRFVGHPLSERLDTHVYKPLPFTTRKPILSLFPGSRRKEIERNLPLMLKACLIKQTEEDRFQIALSLSEERFRPLVEELIKDSGFSQDQIQIVPSSLSYELMKASEASIAKSGTVTLELAFHRIPTIVVYAVSFLDRLIAYYLLRIRLPFYCLVNIIAGREVFPELIGPHFTLSRLLKEMSRISDANYRETVQEQCNSLIQTLSSKRTAQEAATAILHLFS